MGKARTAHRRQVRAQLAEVLAYATGEPKHHGARFFATPEDFKDPEMPKDARVSWPKIVQTGDAEPWGSFDGPLVFLPGRVTVRETISCRAYRPAPPREGEIDASANYRRLPLAWSADIVTAWLTEACDTARSIDVGACWPSERITAALPIVHEAVEAYGWSDVEVRSQPGIEEIWRLDFCMPAWLGYITGDDAPRMRAAVLGVCTRQSLRRIAEWMGCSHETVRHLQGRGIAAIVAALNSHPTA